ncbi:hypothetical protein CU097_004303 [Rhizopus azygosporus]|uniref:Uncharacterized protein n=1 Tax=Rhizopus azygosporus TaxID=86630 RepID=A0A367J460_RHIAZ|nr:hypothetical protein CU097_004303 [Rhizopus azygosporus]
MSVPEFFNNNEIVYCSEQDFIIKAWGPILSEIFKQAKLTLRWGDTTMENTAAPFKVDLRVICTINGNRYDVGFVEFAKNFTASKAQKDRVKLILEGKEALNTVFKVIGKYVPDIEFYTLQIAGLKGHLISTTLQSNGLYTAQNINNRIRFPLTNNDIFDQTSHLMKAIIKFKEQCLKINDVLEKALAIKNQERLSFETVLDKSAKKKYRSQPLPLSVIKVPGYCTPLWLEEGYEDE